jgi:hypothetical protein
MSGISVKYSAAPLRQAQKTIRGIRAASIPVATPDAVIGVHLIQWVGAYQFGTFVTPSLGSPTQLGSLFHAGMGSRGISQDQATGGRAAYFNSSAKDDKSLDDETFQGVMSPPDTAGQPIQVPLFGANKLAASLFVQDTLWGGSSSFKLTLYRVVQASDNVNFMANNADSNFPVAQWMFQGAARATNTPQLNFSGFELSVGTSFYLELVNLTNNANTNMMAGDIFFHS